MTTRDLSQMPVERLAQLLLQCAQADAVLPRRAPANDDELHARYVDAMFDRIEALPELRREPQPMRREPDVALPLVSPVDIASNEELEELVAVALASAHDAEDIAREPNEASRRARRGMFVAVGAAALGIMVAVAGAVVARLPYSGNDQQMAEIAGQVQALGDLQRHIDAELVQLHAQSAVQHANAVREASAMPAPPSMAPSRDSDAVAPPLGRLKATEVPVLAAVPAVAQTTPVAASQHAGANLRPASYAPATSYAAHPPAVPPPIYTAYTAHPNYAPPADYAPGSAYAPHVVYHRQWTPYQRLPPGGPAAPAGGLFHWLRAAGRPGIVPLAPGSPNSVVGGVGPRHFPAVTDWTATPRRGG